MRKNFLFIGLIVATIISCVGQNANVLSPKDFKSKMNASAIVLDVRTVDEFKSGHLEKAVNIDINGGQFEKQSSQLDKAKPILIYCLAGKRSNKAAQILRTKGFTVLELEGGIDAWQQQGLPVVK